MPIPTPTSPPDDSLPLVGAAGPGSSQVFLENPPIEFGQPNIEYPANMWRLEEIAASATVSLDSPFCVRCDCTAGAVSVTLTSSAQNALKMAHIMKTDSSANAVTVVVAAGDTWYGDVAAQTLATQYKSVTLLAVNNNNVSGWHVIATT
jgi:hypothetical protein